MQRVTQRFWRAALAAGLLVAVLVAPRAEPAPGEDQLVLAADTALADAMRAGDKSAVRRLLSLEFTYTDANGALHGRKQFVTDLKSVAPAAATGVNVKIYGLVAMVTGNRKSALGSDVFYLDIWVKEKRAWRALAMQDVLVAAGALAAGPVTPEEAGLRGELAKVFDCKNPCETIPYRVRSPAEQDIVNTFQAIAKATFAHDADGYAKHLADEFMHYESGVAPAAKPERVAHVENEKAHNIPAILTAIQSMQLWVYGDGAAMLSVNGVPGDSEPLLRIARVWVKRNGQWQMAISVQTDVK
jgi:ketosteroid isomerase-like protein